MARRIAWIVVCFSFAVTQAFCAGIDFSRDVQPIFAQHCFECHGPDKQEGGFRLDVRSSATGEAESGERPIVGGRTDQSELIARITSSDSDVRMPPGGQGVGERDIERLKDWIAAGAEYTQHWAYRPLPEAKLPSVSTPDWCVSPIDYFVLARLDATGLKPSPGADRSTLIKRLYYDLIGLPPTPEEVDRFAADASPSAYASLVDRLLSSPHFGERWGRHWLDKARYADSDGYEKDNSRPNAWHYRDWVIDAINNDLPFDQFTREQLAGDLIPDASDAQRLATAFNRQTLTNTEGGTDKEQWRVAAVMDRTETLGTVWLGLTVGCARCHNHKYDQISQDEYYQLYAFFNNGDETILEIGQGGEDKLELRVVSQREVDRRRTHVLHRGDFLQPQHEVSTGTLSTLPVFASRNGARSDGDRLDLAEWLVDGRNPLPLRVAVNHAWQHLFGKGLVRTPNDFGIRGETPTHSRLLDWLANELDQIGWSRKALIRTIVLSNTYRQSSRHRPEVADVDPMNRLLHRQNRFRVEAEIVRDITLAASGLLSAKIGGPSVFPPIPPSITDLTYNSGFRWEDSVGEDRFRRGMYTFFKRTAPHPNLMSFDCPNSNVTSVERETSNTPIAALVTLNNAVYVEAAREFAHRLVADFDSDRVRLEELIRRCLAREPLSIEMQRLEDLLVKAKTHFGANPARAKELVSNADPVEAAWTVTARVVLNLDEFLTRE